MIREMLPVALICACLMSLTTGCTQKEDTAAINATEATIDKEDVNLGTNGIKRDITDDYLDEEKAADLDDVLSEPVPEYEVEDIDSYDIAETEQTENMAQTKNTEEDHLLKTYDSTIYTVQYDMSEFICMESDKDKYTGTTFLLNGLENNYVNISYMSDCEYTYDEYKEKLTDELSSDDYFSAFDSSFGDGDIPCYVLAYNNYDDHHYQTTLIPVKDGTLVIKCGCQIYGNENTDEIVEDYISNIVDSVEIKDEYRL